MSSQIFTIYKCLTLSGRCRPAVQRTFHKSRSSTLAGHRLHSHGGPFRHIETPRWHLEGRVRRADTDGGLDLQERRLLTSSLKVRHCWALPALERQTAAVVSLTWCCAASCSGRGGCCACLHCNSVRSPVRLLTANKARNPS